MTLDEMIAWLEDRACLELAHSSPDQLYGRGQAATLLAIENALRAVRMEQFGEIVEAAAESVAKKVLRGQV